MTTAALDPEAMGYAPVVALQSLSARTGIGTACGDTGAILALPVVWDLVRRDVNSAWATCASAVTGTGRSPPPT